MKIDKRSIIFFGPFFFVSIDRLVPSVSLGTIGVVQFLLSFLILYKQPRISFIFVLVSLVVAQIYLVNSHSTDAFNYFIGLSSLYVIIFSRVQGPDWLNLTRKLNLFICSSIIFQEFALKANHGSGFGYFEEGNVISFCLLIFWWISIKNEETKTSIYTFTNIGFTALTLFVAVITGSKFLLLSILTIFVILSYRSYIFRYTFVFAVLPALYFYLWEVTTILFKESSIIIWRLGHGQSLLTALLSGRDIRVWRALAEFYDAPSSVILFGDLWNRYDYVKYVEAEPFNTFFELGLLGGALFFGVILTLGYKILAGRREEYVFLLFLITGIAATGHIFNRPLAMFALAIYLVYIRSTISKS